MLRGARHRLRAVQPAGQGLPDRQDRRQDTTFDDADFRNIVPRFTPEAMQANQALVDLLTRIADGRRRRRRRSRWPGCWRRSRGSCPFPAREAASAGGESGRRRRRADPGRPRRVDPVGRLDRDQGRAWNRSRAISVGGVHVGGSSTLSVSGLIDPMTQPPEARIQEFVEGDRIIPDAHASRVVDRVGNRCAHAAECRVRRCPSPSWATRSDPFRRGRRRPDAGMSAWTGTS